MTVLNSKFLDDDGVEPIWGDTLQVDITSITNIPSGEALQTMYLTIKRRRTDTDLQAALQLSITSSSTSAGQITDTGSGDQTGAAEFFITGSSWNGIDKDRVYEYDISYITDGGSKHTLEEGTARFRSPVTLTNS